MDVALLSGLTSTTLFAIANLPMLVKAARTRDLTSYSLGYLLLGNAANAVHTVYVLSLPVGPVWVLHGFYLVTMAAMLALYARFGRRPRGSRPALGAPRLRQVDRGEEHRVGGLASASGRTPGPARGCSSLVGDACLL